MRAELPDAGFTLIEVLVALVLSALLTSILMGGAYQARQRVVAATQTRKAVFLARSVLVRATAEPYDAAPSLGTTNGLDWRVSEQILLKDPRQRWMLVELSIDVSKADRLLDHATTRQLMTVPTA